jgi:hypothetical protein
LLTEGIVMLKRLRCLSLGVAAVLAMMSLAQAQGGPGRIRGTVAAVHGTEIEIMTREGAKLTLQVADSTRFSAVKALDLAAIKQGSFIGAAGKPTANGGVEALEVVVFPEEARGTGEGHYGWDLLPGSSMTNATVASVVSGSSGRDLEMVYQGKSIKIKVPKDVPVVTFVPAALSDLRPGLAVFAVVPPTAAGAPLAAARIVMERDGVKPPM